MATHLVWPLHVNRLGRLDAAEQDSDPDISSCLLAILRTPQGWRTDSPDFGRPKGLTFAQNGVSVQAISDAIADQEPRADAQVVASLVLDQRQTVTVNPTGGSANG